MTFYAYIHARPDTTDQSGVFYVGKGSGDRLRQFYSRNRWHRFTSKKHGVENILIGKLDCSSEAIAFDLERGLIKCLRRAGVTLTNMTDGGEGPSGHVMSEEAKAKIAAHSREMAKRPEVIEARRKASSVHGLERWSDPAYRARMTEAFTGKTKTRSEASDQARRANGGKGQTEEVRAKKAAASKALWASPEHRAKMAEKKRLAWQDPEKRASMLAGRSEGIKKSWEDVTTRNKRIRGIKLSSNTKRKDI